MAERAIAGYHRDEEGHWVAELACGHGQHLRHQPPFQVRGWVLSETGRSSMLGRMLECHFCDMPHLPEGAATYKQTREFDEHSVPKGLLASHRTRAGTWGRIVVLEGLLLYSIYEPRIDSWVLRPGIDGILEPTRSHWVRPQGPVRFRVEFLRVEPTR